MVTANEKRAGPDARWISEHWWSSRFELTSNDCIVASVDIHGSGAMAEIDGIRYLLSRMRLPAYVMLREADSDAPVARLCLIPANTVSLLNSKTMHRSGSAGQTS